MSAAPLASVRRDKTETTTARNRRARREITAAMRAKRINLALCDFLQLVIDECHLDTFAYHSRAEWAAIVGKSVSSIKLYIRVACDAGLTRLDAAGRLYVLGLETPGAAPAEPVFLAPEPVNALPQTDNFLSDLDNVLTPPSFNVLIQDLQGIPQQASAGGVVPPIEGNAETIDLLTDLGVYPETARRLGHVAPEVVRETIDQADRCGRARDLAAFVAFALEHGGVYGARAKPRASPARHGPRHAAPSPGGGYSVCGCGRVVPAEWEGHCPACYPEMFDPPPGGAP